MLNLVYKVDVVADSGLGSCITFMLWAKYNHLMYVLHEDSVRQLQTRSCEISRAVWPSGAAANTFPKHQQMTICPGVVTHI
jgi:hypothetical protein